jgi:hypothetical protein
MQRFFRPNFGLDNAYPFLTCDVYGALNCFRTASYGSLFFFFFLALGDCPKTVFLSITRHGSYEVFFRPNFGLNKILNIHV